jgi:uncharacterized protein
MHPNEALVRAGYEAFVSGDLETVARLIDPDVLWHVGGSSPLAGVYKGHPELFALLARLGQSTGGTISVSARDILTSEDHVIVLTTLKAERDGRVLEDDGVAVFKIFEGKATEVWVFAENQGAIDAFFA